MLLTKGTYRRLQLCSAIGLHCMCLSEMRGKDTEVSMEKLAYRETMVVLVVPKLMRPSNLERNIP